MGKIDKGAIEESIRLLTSSFSKTELLNIILGILDEETLKRFLTGIIEKGTDRQSEICHYKQEGALDALSKLKQDAYVAKATSRRILDNLQKSPSDEYGRIISKEEINNIIHGVDKENLKDDEKEDYDSLIRAIGNIDFDGTYVTIDLLEEYLNGLELLNFFNNIRGEI